jgi:hydroxymethylpyrimidine pyrophosphatase-like HAD family hydrolase
MFSTEGYYANKKLPGHKEEEYRAIMGRTPQMFVFKNNGQLPPIVKVNLYAFSHRDKRAIDECLPVLLRDQMHANPWSENPALGSVSIRNITQSGVSKYSGAVHLLNHLNVPFESTLGIGDTLHDWDFIEHCGYKGVMSNATDELKDKFDFDDPNQVMGGHVDEDGVLDVFRSFQLI